MNDLLFTFLVATHLLNRHYYKWKEEESTLHRNMEKEKRELREMKRRVWQEPSSSSESVNVCSCIFCVIFIRQNLSIALLCATLRHFMFCYRSLLYASFSCSLLFFNFYSGLLCYAILCYAVLCYAVLCYAMLCDALLCYAMLCYAMLSYAMLCYAMLCYAMLCYAMLCYAMLCYAMLYCYAMLCYAMLCYSMLCHAMLCYAVLCYAMLWQPAGLLQKTCPPSNHILFNC